MPNQEPKKRYEFFAPKACPERLVASAVEPSRRVFIRTFGCQMNARDSEIICGLLQKQGYRIVEEPQDAEVILLNTCSVRQRAEDKVWSEIGRFGESVDKKPKSRSQEQRAKNQELRARPIIGLIGCMAQNYKEQVFGRAKRVDFIAGPSDIHKIPAIIRELTQGQNIFERKIWETDGDVRPEEIYHTGFYKDKNHSYVVISEGCSNFCSYCVVPYVRGNLKNRNYQDILREIEEAIDKGIGEVTLLGQNVNAYAYNGFDFLRLLELVNSVKGLKEFSFITSHPKDASVDLFMAMASLSKLKKYLHLPVQSGSDRILKLMNRGYTRKFYLDLTHSYRKIIKDAVLTTDIILGFPTETEDDFQDTLGLIKSVEFDAAYIFKYSFRPHTQAESFPDDVTKGEKERRHYLTLELQKKISKSKI